MRSRRDEWIAAGVFEALHQAALDAYVQAIGLDLWMHRESFRWRGGKSAARPPRAEPVRETATPEGRRVGLRGRERERLQEALPDYRRITRTGTPFD
ncbi:hypothetical protein GCM10010270_74680 [Streptomyces violaceus]|nr:hypothetical protein GCM10010270_74680 [Streptomyces janthinus]